MSRCERLHTLIISDCDELREILRLPYSIRRVEVEDCDLLDLQSLFQLVPEIIGLPPNLPQCLGVTSHMLKFPYTKYLGNEFDLCEYSFEVKSDENDIPNWFNHQRDGELLSFSIGPDFPTIALCIAFGIEGSYCHFFYDVIISINGSERTFERKCIEMGTSFGYLCFSFRPQSSLQELFGDMQLTDRNHVEILCETLPYTVGGIFPIVERIGVHVECNCPPPQNPSILQILEIIGLPPNLPPCLGVTSHTLMSPYTKYLGDELDLCEYSFEVKRDENDIPNWFNHKSNGGSISFSIGPEFPTIALCSAFGNEDYCDFFYGVIISINGSERVFERKIIERGTSFGHLCFCCRPQSSLQELFRDMQLTDRNHVEIFCEVFPFSDELLSREYIAPIVERIGVHVECNCPPPQKPSIFQDINRHPSLHSGLGLSNGYRKWIKLMFDI